MKKHFIISFALFVLVHIFSVKSEAQVTQIQPDRPDQTESPNIIPVKTFQFEAGFVYEADKNNGGTVKNLSYPSALLRYGMLSNLELRMEIENTKSDFETGGQTTSVSGIKPISLGLKVNVLEEKGILPAAGIIINFSLPNAASKELKSNNLGSSINFAFENSITDKLSLGYNLGSSWDGNTTEANVFYSMSLGYSICKCVSAFVEGYGFMPENTSSNHRFDFGVSLFPLKNFSLDASAGFGITKNAPDYFINGGFSLRLPK